MNDLYIYSALSCITILFFLPALWVKLTFSGDKFTLSKLCIAVLYNFTFVIVYWRYADEEYLPFIGIKNNEILRALAVIVSLAYIFVLPTPWKNRSRPS